MRFNVHALKNGKSVVYQYETDGSRIWDPSGTEIFSEQILDSVTPSHLPFTRNINPNKKSQKNDLLEIMLGGKCNFKCEYCSQLPIRDLVYSGNPSDVKPFIDLLKSAAIDCSRIQLWGGEPLVYWKVLQKLVPLLRDLYPKTPIMIITNGFLLDLEKAVFFVEHNICCGISHDGPAQSKRGEDVLNKKQVLDAVNYIKEKNPNLLMFGCTPSKGNLNVENVIHFFNTMGVDGNRVCVHNIVRCHISSSLAQKESCYLTQEERDLYSDSVFELLNSGYQGSIANKRDSVVYTILSKASLNTVRAECNLPFSNGLMVNLKGDIFQCHNHAIPSAKQGNLAGLANVNAIGYEYWENKKRCRECPYIHGCKGGCPSSDDLANELACPNLKALYKGIYKAAFASLLGIYVTDITPCKGD